MDYYLKKRYYYVISTITTISFTYYLILVLHLIYIFY